MDNKQKLYIPKSRNKKYITFSHPQRSQTDTRSHETIIRPKFTELEGRINKYK